MYPRIVLLGKSELFRKTLSRVANIVLSKRPFPKPRRTLALFCLLVNSTNVNFKEVKFQRRVFFHWIFTSVGFSWFSGIFAFSGKWEYTICFVLRSLFSKSNKSEPGQNFWPRSTQDFLYCSLISSQSNKSRKKEFGNETKSRLVVDDN